MRKLLLAFLVGGISLCQAQHTIAIGSNKRYCTLELTAQEWTDWNDNDAFNNATKRETLTKELYSKFDDNFDFVFYILNRSTRPANLQYTGQLIQVSNATTGIGSSMSLFDNTADYGSNGQLQAVMILTKNTDLLLGPSLHELAHNWGNFALEAKNFYTSEYNAIPHWGFTGCGGQLGGFAQSELITNVNGNPNKYTGLIDGGAFGTFANGGTAVKYSNFEQYLMGLIPASSITSFDMFSGITSYDGASGTFEASTKTTYDKNSLVALLGNRSPSATTSKKDFKILVCVLTESALTAQQKTDFDFQTENFDRNSATDYNISQGGSYHNFYTATDGLGTVDLDLSQSVTNVTQLSLSTKVKIGDLYPNPSKGELNAQFDAKEFMSLKYAVIDQLGRTVVEKDLSVSKGNQIIQLVKMNLSAGAYVVKFSDTSGGLASVSKAIVVK